MSIPSTGPSLRIWTVTMCKGEDKKCVVLPEGFLQKTPQDALLAAARKEPRYIPFLGMKLYFCGRYRDGQFGPTVDHWTASFKDNHVLIIESKPVS